MVPDCSGILMLYCTSTVPRDDGSGGVAFPDTKVVGTRGGLGGQILGTLIRRFRSIFEVPQKTPAFLQPSTVPPTEQLNSLSSTSFQVAKMSHINSFNPTNSFNNVWNNCTIADSRPQILAWLSPLEPRLRHQDIRDRRVENVGEWLLQAEEFRSWYASGGRSESDNAALFCYGDPGVGKTYIR